MFSLSNKQTEKNHIQIPVLRIIMMCRWEYPLVPSPPPLGTGHDKLVSETRLINGTVDNEANAETIKA